MFYHIIKFLVRVGMSLAFKIKIEGRDNIPDNEQVIYVSNHRTNIDPPLISMCAKGKFVFMAKEELFKNKVFSMFIMSLGAFPVSRGKGDTSVIDMSVGYLNNGRSLVIFPEGTRSKDSKVQRGHSGAAVIAARSGKKIIPTGVIFRKKLKFRTKITIKYGEPIDPKDYIKIKPNLRQFVKLKNRYMAAIKLLVEEKLKNEDK